LLPEGSSRVHACDAAKFETASRSGYDVRGVVWLFSQVTSQAKPGKETPMRVWAAPKRTRIVDIITGLVVLAVLIGVGRIAMFGRDVPAPNTPSQESVAGVNSPAGSTKSFSPAEQQIVALLPPGFSGSACTRATDAFPNSLASLDCTSNITTDTPTYARFTLYKDLEALIGDFQTTADGMMLSPCPGSTAASPGTWTYGADANQVSGRIVCGTIADRANIAWTRDAQLLLATVNGGPSLNSLYQWFQRFGVQTQH
jgi:hypothetical protein